MFDFAIQKLKLDFSVKISVKITTISAARPIFNPF